MANKTDIKNTTEETHDITLQENVSPRNNLTRQGSAKQQVRHRASVACAACRERRIRCVVPKGDRECTQCKRTGTECIIKNDDERRRPISKAYMSSLSERITLLESMLAEQGVQPPPAVHPPKTRHEAHSTTSEAQPKPSEKSHSGATSAQPGARKGTPSKVDVPSPPDSANEDFTMQDSDQADSTILASGGQLHQTMTKETSPFRNLDPKQEDIVHRLLSTKGNLSFDQLSGRLRFFGPTANSHVYAEPPDQFDSREPPEQVRRAERIIRSLSATTHDYLMNNYWVYYNSMLNVVHQDAFQADRESQNPRFYSSFLHIAILAMGYRFADFQREDMKRITLADRESTLHREAKYMLDIELERPGGIPSVQALLLLGDLECGVGRDNTGWMYAGMANRLAFDIGLHLDCRNNGISDLEVEIRHMTMKACVIFDKYWALFLGRPTSIKNQDIGMDLLSKRFSQLSSSGSNGQSQSDKKSIGAEIYEQLIELMELAGRIVERRENNRVSSSGGGLDHGQIFSSNTNEGEENGYLHVVNLDLQLQNWYRRLPEHLQWKPANIKTAPFNFFLLHQQYHVSMILLHRPWANYGAITGNDGTSTGSHPSPASGVAEPVKDPATETMHHTFPSAMSNHNHSIGMGDPHSMVDDSRTSLSRSICTQQAIRVARIFWQHRQRFDGTKISVTAIQHAGTAAIALIAALAYTQSESDRRTYLGYLEILGCAISDMSHTYHPAARMDDLLKVVLAQLRADINDPTGAHRAAAPPALTGSDRSILSESGWRGSMDNIYSILPVRRDTASMTGGEPETERAGSRGGAPNKRRRGTTSRRASEFTRPPPPFFPPQQTPPKSSHSQGQNSSFSHPHAPHVDPALYGLGSGGPEGHDHHHHMSHHHQQQQQQQHHNHNQGFSLDFLNGSAIETDLDDGVEGLTRPADDFVLVGNGDDGAWGGPSMRPSGEAGDRNGNGNGFDMQLSEWMSGPGGLSVGSILSNPSMGPGGPNGMYGGSGSGNGGATNANVNGGGHARTDSGMGRQGGGSGGGGGGGSGAAGDEAKEEASNGNANATPANSTATPSATAPAPGTGNAGGAMDWMGGGESGMNTLSPVSLGGLVQSAVGEGNGPGGAVGGNGKGPTGPNAERGGPGGVEQLENGASGAPRNHELDFFSF